MNSRNKTLKGEVRHNRKKILKVANFNNKSVYAYKTSGRLVVNIK